MKIILVEDNPDFRDDLKFLLERNLPHTIIAETKNGNELLTLENQREADIILMDLTMERVNGFAAIKKILSEFPYLKIIAMTMYNETLPLMKLQEIGFKGFIIKTEIFKSLEVIIESVYSDEFVFSKDYLKRTIYKN
jgi:DNA-binding NarL/FixJ family response regulator